MDAVIKVGGSLAENPNALRSLCFKLGDYAQKYAFAIVPGGGRFADVVRKYDHAFSLSPATSHRMAILGMDQYGLLLADIVPQSHLVNSWLEFRTEAECKSAKIIIPSTLMSEEDPLENSWNVTSDSIAAYFAHQSHATRLILITDVDGIFSKDPKLYSDAMLIRTVLARELLTLNNRSCVDCNLPKLLIDYSLNCYVVNGNHPERIGSILSGKKTICTRITANHEDL
jgi:aspartokinase-like uncharacterized kinase